MFAMSAAAPGLPVVLVGGVSMLVAGSRVGVARLGLTVVGLIDTMPGGREVDLSAADVGVVAIGVAAI